MNYNEFENAVIERLSKKAGKDCEIVPTSVLKNNNTTLKGLRFVSAGNIIQPTIYLDSFYCMYKRGQEIDEIADEIYEDYEASKLGNTPDLSFFTDYSRMKERIVCKLINAEKNAKLLKKIPYVPFLDLAVVFYCRIDLAGAGTGTILIHQSHFDEWGITLEEMYRDALANNRKLLKGRVTPIEDVLNDILFRMKERGENCDAPAFSEEDQKIPMYVLTNEYSHNGAACMLDNGILKDFSQKNGGDFFIIPSSIHELILMPAMSGNSSVSLKEIVKTINATEVSKDEVLSDEVYMYDVSKNAVVLA